MYSEDTRIIYYIITVIIGLVIGIIIGIYLFKKDIYKGPDSNIIKKNIYEEKDGRKYKWVPKITICPISYSMYKLKDNNFIDEHD
jgi:uncharacterized protein YxeA